MSTPPTTGVTKRATGASKGVAFGEDNGTEIPFMGEDAQWLINAYNSDRTMDREKIETTAYGDFPFRTYEPGFIDLSSNISMRHQVTDGALAADVAFMEDHALTGQKFRIAIVDDRRSTTPNGIIMTVSAMQVSDTGDFASAQDHAYSLSIAPGKLAPMKIRNGVVTPFIETEED